MGRGMERYPKSLTGWGLTVLRKSGVITLKPKIVHKFAEIIYLFNFSTLIQPPPPLVDVFIKSCTARFQGRIQYFGGGGGGLCIEKNCRGGGGTRTLF